MLYLRRFHSLHQQSQNLLRNGFLLGDADMLQKYCEPVLRCGRQCVLRYHRVQFRRDLLC